MTAPTVEKPAAEENEGNAFLLNFVLLMKYLYNLFKTLLIIRSFRYFCLSAWCAPLNFWKIEMWKIQTGLLQMSLVWPRLQSMSTVPLFQLSICPQSFNFFSLFLTHILLLFPLTHSWSAIGNCFPLLLLRFVPSLHLRFVPSLHLRSHRKLP